MKEYEVGEELRDLWIENLAAKSLMDAALKFPFGYKKALKASKEAAKIRDRFWESIYKLYPELRKETITYHHSRGVVEIKKGDD